jgi:hypothetical protein
MRPIRQNGWLLPFLPLTAMPPIRQNGRIYKKIAISMPPIRQNGWLIPFLPVTAMPPIRQNGRINRNITTSMHPIRQNRWTYTNLVCNRHAIHTPKCMEFTTVLRDRHATHTPKSNDHSYHHYHHATPYTKMDGLMPLLHATAMPPIHQDG